METSESSIPRTVTIIDHAGLGPRSETIRQLGVTSLSSDPLFHRNVRCFCIAPLSPRIGGLVKLGSPTSATRQMASLEAVCPRAPRRRRIRTSALHGEYHSPDDMLRMDRRALQNSLWIAAAGLLMATGRGTAQAVPEQAPSSEQRSATDEQIIPLPPVIPEPLASPPPGTLPGIGPSEPIASPPDVSTSSPSFDSGGRGDMFGAMWGPPAFRLVQLASIRCRPFGCRCCRRSPRPCPWKPTEVPLNQPPHCAITVETTHCSSRPPARG